MKLTTVLLFTALIQVSAAGYGQRISVSGQNISLKNVFRQIEKQSGYSFFYFDDDLKHAKAVTINAFNVELSQVLNEAFKDQPLTYSILGKTIVVKEKVTDNSVSAVHIFIDIRGRVLDEEGKGIEGVTVVVKGTSTGVATDKDGVFSLRNIDPRAVLVFSGINVQTREISLNGRNNLTVTLNARVAMSDEVTVMVNTGYQSISAERSAGSFAKPNKEILANRSTSMNVLDRLDGLVPGLTVNKAPNTDNFLIRGASSINGNRAPLYVVDGIPMTDLTSINPQDIADVTVLKDATAASIWGSKASNGVIVIATKKGTSSDGLRISYDAFVNFQGRPDLNYIPTLNSREFIQVAKEIFDPVAFPWSTVSAYSNTGSTGVAPHEHILYNQYRGLISAEQANKSLDSLAGIDNRQQIADIWYRDARLMNHTLSLSGGGKLHSFYGSLAYTSNQSSTPGETNNLYKLNLRQDFNINPRIQLYLINDITTTNASGKRPVDINNRFYPYQLFRDNNGINLSMPYMTTVSDSTRTSWEERSRISMDYSPLNEFENGYTKTDALLNRTIGGATIKLLPGLRFEGVYGYIKGTNRSNSYDGEDAYIVRSERVQFTQAATPATTPVYFLPSKGGRYSVTNLTQRNWTVRNQLAYEFAGKKNLHQLNLLAGQEAQEQFQLSNRSTVRGYDELLQTYAPIDYATLGTTGVTSPVMPNNLGRSIIANDAFNQTEFTTRFTSYYANAAYTFDRKYSLNGSWRIDQSNLFGKDKSAQNKPVWSVGAKWNVSDEDFLQSAFWINKLALRATYGITGNPPLPGTAASYDILSAATNNFFPNRMGLRIFTPGNERLTWESTRTMNLGLDLRLLKNRLSASVDVYSKKTDNLIGNLIVNSFTGYASITGNFGDLQNKGFELSINAQPVAGRQFQWHTLLNLAYNKNTITNLYSASPITTGAQKISERFLAGYPAFAVFAYQYAGLDSIGDPQIYVGDKAVTKARNVAMPDDVLLAGTYQPKWNGGLSNMLRYQNLSLTMNAVYNFGHVMRRDVGSFYATNSLYSGRLSHSNVVISDGFTTGNVNPIFLERWQQSGDEARTNVPAYVSNTSLSSTRRDVTYFTRGDINILDASFIKLRDITLAYSLPSSLVDKLKAETISFRLQVSNLMLWTANSLGIDPEFQDPIYGIRYNKTNQGTITAGVHVSF